MCVLQAPTSLNATSSGGSGAELEVLATQSYESGIAAVALLPDGKTAVVGLKSSCYLRLYDTELLQARMLFRSHTTPRAHVHAGESCLRVPCMDGLPQSFPICMIVHPARLEEDVQRASARMPAEVEAGAIRNQCRPQAIVNAQAHQEQEVMPCRRRGASTSTTLSGTSISASLPPR